ncbi:MAG: hypothetical protein AAF734_12065, partial [Bacteroidota bacterium]
MRRFITLLLTITVLTSTWAKQKKAKCIILMIGPDRRATEFYVGLVAKKGKLALEWCQYIGLFKISSANDYIVTTKKAYNSAITLDMKKEEENDLATDLA